MEKKNPNLLGLGRILDSLRVLERCVTFKLQMLITNTDEKKNLLPEYSQCASYPFPGILTQGPKEGLKTYKSNQKYLQGN